MRIVYSKDVSAALDAYTPYLTYCQKVEKCFLKKYAIGKWESL